MFTFDSLKTYAEKWQVINSERINSDELSKIDHAEVVHSDQYDTLDVKVTLKSGGYSFIGLSSKSILSVGDSVDLSKGVVQTLKKDDKTIIRFLED